VEVFRFVPRVGQFGSVLEMVQFFVPVGWLPGFESRLYDLSVPIRGWRVRALWVHLRSLVPATVGGGKDSKNVKKNVRQQQNLKQGIHPISPGSCGIFKDRKGDSGKKEARK